MSPATICRWFLAMGLLTTVLAAPALSTSYSWTSATPGDWSLAGNWTPGGGPPGVNPADTAAIDAFGSDYTVTLNQNPTISGFTLNSGNATFSANARSLTVNGASQLLDGDVLWQGSTWGGTGTLTNSTDFTVQSASSITAPFQQDGNLVINSHAAGWTAQLTVSNGFTNTDSIVLTSAASVPAYLNVTTGTLTNAPGALIDTQAGAGGMRRLNTHLTNDGTVEIGTDTQLTKSSGQYVNNNSFTIAPGATLTMTGGGKVFTQDAGTLDIAGAFDISSGTLNYDGGTITGTPRLNASTLNIGPGGTSPASFTLNYTNNFTGNVSVGQVLDVEAHQAGLSAHLNAVNGFTNDGTINLTSLASVAAYVNVSTGTLTNMPGGLIDVQAGAGGMRYLNTDLTNDGTVEIGTDTQLNKASGQYLNNSIFTIAPGATLTMSGGGRVFTQDAGTLDIAGDFDITSATFNYNGGTILGTPRLNASTLNIGPGGTAPVRFTLNYTNNFTGNVSPGQVLDVEAHQAGLSAQLIAANGFTNDGTINLTSLASVAAYLNVSTGTLTNAPGGLIDVQAGAGGMRYLNTHLTNDGTVEIGTDTQLYKASGQYINNNNFTIAPGATLTMSGSGKVFTQAAGTLDIAGAFDISSGTLNYDGGTITGTPVLFNSTLNLGPGGTAPASFTLNYVNYLTGNVSPGQVLDVEAHQAGLPAQLVAAGGYTNHGTINLTSTASERAYLTLNSGVVTNMPGGLIDVQAGAGGVRYLNTDLTNDGTVEIGTDTQLYKASGQYINNSIFTIAPGATLTMSGSGKAFTQAAGTLDIAGAFDISSGTLNYDGGTITGTPVLYNSNLNLGPGGTAPVRFTLNYTNYLTGNVSPGQVLDVEAHQAGLSAQLIAANGYTNDGTINLTSTASEKAYLTVWNGTLTNDATGLIDCLEGLGDNRYINTHLDNDGLVRIGAPTYFNRSGGQYVNAGTIRLLDNHATFTGNSLTNEVGGLITGAGTLTASAVTFINHGTVAPGLSPGILEFVGTYDQSETGLLQFEVGGYTVDDRYDRLAVTGAALLDGLVDVDLIDLFIPDPGDRFDVLTATGGITDNGLELVPEDQGTWLINWVGSDTLQVEYVPEPATLALLAVGLGSLACRRRRQSA